MYIFIYLYMYIYINVFMYIFRTYKRSTDRDEGFLDVTYAQGTE